MAIDLPDDILHIICETVADDRQDDQRGAFDTLFSCAVSSRRLSVPALTTLYRFQHVAPVKGGEGGSEALTLASDLQSIQKWSILWRSILLSCLDKTVFPYCKYVKVLDFRDLHNLFEDDMFRIHVSSKFFSGELKEYQKLQQTPSKFGGRGRGPIFDRVSMIDAIGELLTQHTPMAEGITGPLLTSSLVRWIPRLPRLRSLQLWDGQALDDELLPNLITVHCPKFEDLAIYTWTGQEADHKLAAFLSGLPSNRLRSIVTYNNVVAAESFLALNSHSSSLRDLKLWLSNDAIPHMGLLKGCNQLESLDITDDTGTIDLKASQHDVFLEVVAWLRDCHSLRRLNFTDFSSAAAILALVLADPHVKLEQLKIDSYQVREQRPFHEALSHQTSLTSLFLRGNSDGIFADDRTAFVEALCALRSLRDLKLVFRSDEIDLLTDVEIGALAEELPELEEFYTSGYGVTDAVLPKVSGLRNLRSLDFFAVSSFTADGLLEFISRLGPGNQELALLVDNADPDTQLSEAEQNLVREALNAKVGGRFEYQLLRDEIEDYSDDSD